MAKQRTMNELRQVKEYQGSEASRKYLEVETPNQKCYSEIDVETTKDLIINNLKNNFYDLIFQEVCDEMAKHEVFQAETYFTPQGLYEFEDQWCDFYHEHHGDILSAIMKNFTN